MEIKSILVAAVLGAIGGFGSSYYVMKTQIENIYARLEQTPPVVIVDFVKVASEYPEGASQEEVEKLMLKTNNAIVKLKEAGYLVIDGSAIVSAPNDVYLPSEVLK